MKGKKVDFNLDDFQNSNHTEPNICLSKLSSLRRLDLQHYLTDDRVDELIVAKGQYQIGDILERLKMFSRIDAAFVNIGESEKNGFIHVSDLGPLRLKKESWE